MNRVIDRIRATAFDSLPFVEYYVGLKLALRPRRMLKLDFPVHLNIEKEIFSSDVVLELGASSGGLTKELARLAKEVYSFEPSKKTFKWLIRNTRHFKNLRCFNAAVADVSSRSKLFMHYGGNSLFRLDAQFLEHGSMVDVIGINEIPFSYNTMVIDIEGAEVSLLKAFTKFSQVNKIFCETHYLGGSTLPTVCEILHREGYRLSVDLDPGNYYWVIAKR